MCRMDCKAFEVTWWELWDVLYINSDFLFNNYGNRMGDSTDFQKELPFNSKNCCFI